ncbi:MAG: NUDIX hydrolase [Candidatus Aquilonibacter sp.]
MRLAATVILARPAPGTSEVLMLRRSAASPFMPGAFVFPGGAVDDADYQRGPAEGWTDERIAAEFRATSPQELPVDQPAVGLRDAHALVHAAVRELQEEASIQVDPAQLTLFSHWITPAGEPRRFNTHFFVAAAPAGALGTADSIETHDAQWLSPQRALDAHRNDEMLLVFPTIKHLERLAAFDSVSALLAFAREKPIVTIMPDLPPSAGVRLPQELEGRW